MFWGDPPSVIVIYLSLQSYTYLWMPGELVDNVMRDSFCLKTIANYSMARSPAFDIDGEEKTSLAFCVLDIYM